MVIQVNTFRYGLGVFLFISAVLIVFSGCNRSTPKNDYLIRIGTEIVTEIDFQQSFEIAKTSYPTSASSDAETMKELRMQVLEQLIEKLIVQQRAKEIQIDVSDAELEKAISRIKEDYPEGEFEKTLLESSITYESWKKAFKTRLLMERVMEKDITQKIKITPEDVSEYYEKEFKNKGAVSDQKPSKDIYETILSNLRRKKAEDAYEQWMKDLKSKYPIEINKELWEKLSGA